VYQRASKTNYAESSDEDTKLRAPKRRRRQVVSDDEDAFISAGMEVSDVDEDGEAAPVGYQFNIIAYGLFQILLCLMTKTMKTSVVNGNGRRH
jgi:hypothetical protein